MKRVKLLGLMVMLLLCCSLAEAAPKGVLTYFCIEVSPSEGRGADVYEVEVKGEWPQAVVTLDRGARRTEERLPVKLVWEETQHFFPFPPELVKQLQQLLAKHKIHKLNGYHDENADSGSSTCRMKAIYSKGDSVQLSWTGQPKPEIQALYDGVWQLLEPLMGSVPRKVKQIKMLEGLYTPPKTDTKAPEGRLTYCSFSATRTAGLGKDYCELIADEGTAAKVRVCINVNTPEEKKQEFPVDPQTVDELQQLLASLKVWQLNGYSHDEMMTGGTTCRIYMEYGKGENYNAFWCSHHVLPEAQTAYNTIVRFFGKWWKQVE